ncbi:hypothetical protein [Streptomyces sp. cg36]|uniref:hypothetical protein n=1 Tax=Streptomyces sp. cg36 TaxID=3238798 RepID=UPI0034E1A160
MTDKGEAPAPADRWALFQHEVDDLIRQASLDRKRIAAGIGCDPTTVGRWLKNQSALEDWSRIGKIINLCLQHAQREQICLDPADLGNPAWWKRHHDELTSPLAPASPPCITVPSTASVTSPSAAWVPVAPAVLLIAVTVLLLLRACPNSPNVPPPTPVLSAGLLPPDLDGRGEPHAADRSGPRASLAPAPRPHPSRTALPLPARPCVAAVPPAEPGSAPQRIVCGQLTITVADCPAAHPEPSHPALPAPPGRRCLLMHILYSQ